MNWASLALALANGLCTLIIWMREQSLISTGEQQMLAKILRGQADDIERTQKARDEVRARNSTVPQSSSLPNDGFRRD